MTTRAVRGGSPRASRAAGNFWGIFLESFEFARRMAAWGARIGSPIERGLFAALVCQNWRPANFYFQDPDNWEDQSNYPFVEIISQWPEGPYTIDLLILLVFAPRRSVKCVVECDGHDFHEKTKEQAQRDKKRDRFFQAKGWTVLRFTGSEIFHDAVKCADEISTIILKKLEKKVG